MTPTGEQMRAWRGPAILPVPAMRRFDKPALPEPLPLVMHVAYALLPLGALALALGMLAPGLPGLAAAQHGWMDGAIGLMTLAVMTRAALGLTCRDLAAGAGTTAIFADVLVALVARLAIGVPPERANHLHILSAATWIGAFGGFGLLFGPLQRRTKPEV